MLHTFSKGYSSESTRQIIGNLYSSISVIKNNSTDYIKQKWERELDIEIPLEEWSLMIHAQMTKHKLTKLERLLLEEL